MDDIAKWAQWIKGVQYEVDFWDRYLANKGAPWQEDYAYRLDPTAAADEWLEFTISKFNQTPLRILDVGAGPLTCLGKRSQKTAFELVAVDPLANFYQRLLKKNDIHPPVKTIFGLGENLDLVFGSDSFDIVHCRNALDHSFDPWRCILEMLSVCKEGGYVLLRHAHNEAEKEQYQGFHKWNFTNEGDSFLMWNKEKRRNITNSIADFAYSEILVKDAYLTVLLKKTGPVPSSLLGSHAHRLNRYLEAFLDVMASV